VGPSGAGAERVLADLQRLRRFGVRIAVDDFGTGASSLSFLDQLPIDLLKIDHSFTRNLERAGDRGWMLVAAMLNLGASLRVPTIAEGVETAGQADLLRDLGCPLGQGYHFATPVPAAEMTRYLAGARPAIKELLA
jgi:diguanylate cyclase